MIDELIQGVMREYDEVIDAEIREVKGGDRINLHLTVERGTSKERKAELADNLARLTKTLMTDDPAPTKEFGTGRVAYRIWIEEADHGRDRPRDKDGDIPEASR